MHMYAHTHTYVPARASDTFKPKGPGTVVASGEGN